MNKYCSHRNPMLGWATSAYVQRMIPRRSRRTMDTSEGFRDRKENLYIFVLFIEKIDFSSKESFPNNYSIFAENKSPFIIILKKSESTRTRLQKFLITIIIDCGKHLIKNPTVRIVLLAIYCHSDLPPSVFPFCVLKPTAD